MMGGHSGEIELVIKVGGLVSGCWLMVDAMVDGERAVWDTTYRYHDTKVSQIKPIIGSLREVAPGGTVGTPKSRRLVATYVQCQKPPATNKIPIHHSLTTNVGT